MYSEEELKRIILGVGNAPDFWSEYDSLTNIPFVRQVEEFEEPTVGATLTRANERVQELSQSWIEVCMNPTYSNGIRLIYHIPQTRNQYIEEKLRARRQASPQNNYKHYLFTALNLRNQSSIRNIYVKLLLEHKITTQDFADLVQARDNEINLVDLCGWNHSGQNYFI